MANSQPQLTGEAELTIPTAAKELGGTLQCLVVSRNDTRRGWLAMAALDGGWRTFRCGDVSTAAECIDRTFVHLAIVDLEEVGGRDSEAFRQLAERLAGQAGLLLLICGNEGQPKEEIWARQLGVWMYLAGVTDGPDLSLLCGEALQIAQRLSVSRSTPRPAESISPGPGQERYLLNRTH